MRKSDKTAPYQPTKDESFIKNHLDYYRISNKEQHKIEGLKKDEKYYRVADFYLVRLGVYVEYYGLYNSTKEIRAEYDLKTKVYIGNGLPTVILYPHELGYLDFAFHTKMLKLLRLKKFHKKSKLYRYKLNRYLNMGKGYFLFLSLAMLFISLQALITSKNNYDIYFTIYIVCLGIFGFLLFKFFENIYWIFFRDQ